MNSDEEAKPKDSNELTDVARVENEFLEQRLRQELGRQPTPEELDEWVRQHTEGY